MVSEHTIDCPLCDKGSITVKVGEATTNGVDVVISACTSCGRRPRFDRIFPQAQAPIRVNKEILHT